MKWTCCVFGYYYGVTRSKKIESDRNIRKTRNVFRNLRFYRKRKDRTRQLTSLLKHWRSQAYKLVFTNSLFKDIELKSPFRYGSPSFIRFLFPLRSWLLPEMQISSTNLCRVADIQALSIDGISGGGTEERESLPVGLFVGMSTRVVGRCFWVFTAMEEGSKIDYLFRFHTIPKCEVPFVEGTYFLE